MNNTEINYLVDFIYQDDRITNAEFQMIRDEADKRFDAILECYGKTIAYLHFKNLQMSLYN